MKYSNVTKGIFENRPNRFIAHVNIDGKTEVVHVKNTGRCREILTPGTEVVLSISDNPNRKTKYDLIAAYKPDFGLINIDSQAPNQVVKEWLQAQNFDLIKPEYKFGASRLDFYLEKDNRKILMEVKGCTLEIDGIGYFPDAPTERGTKHLKELTAAVSQGYECYIAFVIQMYGINEVRPNTSTDKAFAEALESAQNSGIKILFLECEVAEDELKIVKVNPAPVR